MSNPNEERSAYRCVVAPENAAAELKVGGRRYLAAVLDTSRNGFTVRIDNAVLKKLKDGGTYELFFDDQHWKVEKQSHYSDQDFTNVGFSRLQELTKIKSPASWLSVFSYKKHVDSDPAFLLYLMLAFLFACVALPGMGDSLGTAPRIQKGVEVICDTVKEFIW